MSEVKVWWADLDESPEEDDISVGTLLREHPRQGPLNWQNSLFQVVKKSDYDALKAKIEKAESVLKYYADRTNYTLDDDFGVSGEMRRRVILYGDQEEFNEVSSAAGRRAREYLRGEG